MKCIYCRKDSKYKDRVRGKCPGCGHAFAFEPKTGDTFTDPAFQAAIDRVSSGGSVKWTKTHLYYEVLRWMAKGRRRSLRMAWAIFIAAAMVLIAGIVFKTAVALILGGIFMIFGLAIRGGVPAPFDPRFFEGLWIKWVAAHGTPKGLIVRKDAPSAQKGRALPADIRAYSFDRAVVTDRTETVDLLVANNFHFENNCAILTMTGYPEQAFETVRAMLQNNPKLSVFVVHDLTEGGCLLARRARASGWFQESARIVDVGLRLQHAKPFESCWRPRMVNAPISMDLGPRERDWLSRYTLELAVIRPEQIIKRLFRALSNEAELPVDDAMVYADSGAFSSDASASDGGGDSFG